MKTTSEANCTEPVRFPRMINNRPALSQLDYLIGDYCDIRQSLLRSIDESEVLSKWTHRGADDPGIALLEGAAIVGDILSFYQNLYANEAFLRTASWRESVGNLVRLMGYRLAPGLGGKAIFSLEVRGEEGITIPAGIGLKAQLEEISKPVDFETTETSIAYPWLSRFHLYRPLEDIKLSTGHTELRVEQTEGETIEFEEDDRLLVGIIPSNDNTRIKQAQVVVVDSVRKIHDETIITIRGAIQLTGEKWKLAAFKVGRSFRHFGHNAPQHIVTVTSTSVNQTDISYQRSLTGTTSTSVVPSLNEKEFPIAEEVDDLPAGGSVIIQSRQYSGSNSPGNSYSHIRTVNSTESISMSWGDLTGASTLINIDETINVGNRDTSDIRRIQIHEVLSSQFTVRALKEKTTDTTGEFLYYFGTSEQARTLKDRRIIWVSPTDNKPVETTVTKVKTTSGNGESLHKLTLDDEVDYSGFPYFIDEDDDTYPIDVLGNLIEANQGKTESEANLGNGDNTQTFQTFALPKAPLTYHYATDESPPQTPELTIWVNDIEWERINVFYGQTFEKQVYIVREDNNGNSYVQFGDGITGSRLPSGVRNVVAKYRTGTGAYGAIKADTTVSATTVITGLDKISLPGVVSGGAEQEVTENAREAAPGTIQSLDRLVSIRDFETEALTIPGVTHAKAHWKIVDGVPTLVVTILMEAGREAEFASVSEAILSSDRCRGANRFVIDVEQGEFEYAYIKARYALLDGYRKDVVEPAILEALGVAGQEDNGIDSTKGLYSTNNRKPGGYEYLLRIEATIQNVEGVAWAKVIRCGTLGTTSDPDSLAFPFNSVATKTMKPQSSNNVWRLYNGPEQNLVKLINVSTTTEGVC